MNEQLQLNFHPMAHLIGTLWEGGPRYFRGEILYRPLWKIIDIAIREHYDFRGKYYKCWMVQIERVDDNAASQPPGFRTWIAPQCFAENGLHAYRRYKPATVAAGR